MIISLLKSCTVMSNMVGPHNKDRLPRLKSFNKRKCAELIYLLENTKKERLATLLYPTITIFCLVVVLALLHRQSDINILMLFTFLQTRSADSNTETPVVSDTREPHLTPPGSKLVPFSRYPHVAISALSTWDPTRISWNVFIAFIFGMLAATFRRSISGILHKFGTYMWFWKIKSLSMYIHWLQRKGHSRTARTIHNGWTEHLQELGLLLQSKNHIIYSDNSTEECTPHENHGDVDGNFWELPPAEAHHHNTSFWLHPATPDSTNVQMLTRFIQKLNNLGKIVYICHTQKVPCFFDCQKTQDSKATRWMQDTS